VVVSSQFCTAERQFRYPLDYGSFSENTAQNTVTAAGAIILEKTNDKTGVFITECLPGIVCDAGIKDASNMGAAMAPAAADTIMRYIGNNKELTQIDVITTGDLGFEGREILLEKLEACGINKKEKIFDCGTLIYDLTRQSVGCGGSGCGCSAFCACGYYMDMLNKKEINNLTLVGTGAMMSPQNLLQGDSIPAIAHLVKFEVK
jgi:stage V sporulation protein AD